MPRRAASVLAAAVTSTGSCVATVDGCLADVVPGFFAGALVAVASSLLLVLVLLLLAVIDSQSPLALFVVQLVHELDEKRRELALSVVALVLLSLELNVPAPAWGILTS